MNWILPAVLSAGVVGLVWSTRQQERDLPRAAPNVSLPPASDVIRASNQQVWHIYRVVGSQEPYEYHYLESHNMLPATMRALNRLARGQGGSGDFLLVRGAQGQDSILSENLDWYTAFSIWQWGDFDVFDGRQLPDGWYAKGMNVDGGPASSYMIFPGPVYYWARIGPANSQTSRYENVPAL